MANKKATTDFDPEKLTEATQRHESGISGLGERVTAIEGKLNTPEQLATTLEAAAKDSKQLDKLFSRLFCEMMAKDDDVKKSLDERIQKADRNAIHVSVKRWGKWVGAALLYIFGVLTPLITELLKKSFGLTK